MTEASAMISGHPFPNCFNPKLLALRRGKGCWLEDVAGRRYLDFAGGIAVNALGYGRADLARTAYKQMRKLPHISNLYTSEPALELGRRMVARGGFQAVQFLNSGSEANETALKYARLYSLRRKGEGCHRLLSFTGGFHGRTFGAVSVTPTPKYQDPFRPLLPGTEVADYNDIQGLEKRIDRGLAGVIVEVVQGEGGLVSMSPDFAAALNRLCRQYDVILIADEVQTGLGRTGTFYASEGVGLQPDLITLAKPLAGGLPLSAVLIPEKVNSLVHPGEHGTTFGGGPVTTAVALKVWEILSRQEFLTEVRQKGERLRELLAALKARCPFLGEIRGKGMLRGIVVPGAEREAEMMPRILAACQEEGLLILRSGANVLRIAPPLTISGRELERGVEILTRVLPGFESALKA